MVSSEVFDDIRPYNDDEVRPTLERLLNDQELLHAVTQLRFPRAAKPMGWLLRPLVSRYLRRQTTGVETILDFQTVVKHYLARMIEETTSRLTTSGLERLDANGAYLFVSNHRDIAMDPAFVNWTIHHAGFHTLRIAIGDNLLTKPYVSDLMRLNKSFVVNRSAKAPREKLKAAKKLSAYIHHSITHDQANIWIAQREGRAKDGLDKTNSAVVGMFSLNRAKNQNFAEYIRQLNIVPVSISYQWDPCDAAKARELYQQRFSGGYQKAQHEDVKSIAMGIAGQKGHVHVAFGEPLQGDYPDNDAVVAELDRQIRNNYVLHASNCFAWQMIHGEPPQVLYSDRQTPFDPSELPDEQAQFSQRMAAIPDEHRHIALEMYANPVNAKLVKNPIEPGN
ncbi:1-acyl-sn-glycerol-3-phosphate acyltransferase [Marinimicrobium sp. ABcell2]|uniref:1-acyl-sn-glycerol-3-phosphate acyltransferase n=1 Tax=Marinimicrobium sp. ABcell2 TaxID=3069751 RepID=UPI0027B596EF|nr:1-acyl-sn-glycerol-3-phosphate acyltransferase [Marinimicrobium sp. ABcell2]MDQ2078438.1 1-acyl-sn-glycerol-3-phosphate acyltransferase [Marinimicrobium sp. ABcell2]